MWCGASSCTSGSLRTGPTGAGGGGVQRRSAAAWVRGSCLGTCAMPRLPGRAALHAAVHGGGRCAGRRCARRPDHAGTRAPWTMTRSPSPRSGGTAHSAVPCMQQPCACATWQTRRRCTVARCAHQTGPCARLQHGRGSVEPAGGSGGATRQPRLRAAGWLGLRGLPEPRAESARHATMPRRAPGAQLRAPLKRPWDPWDRFSACRLSLRLPRGRIGAVGLEAAGGALISSLSSRFAPLWQMR